jgi:transketolase
MPSRSDLANAIRALSMDAVQKANTGHPGAPMGMADIAQVLWGDYMKHNPANPNWYDRDRFVLSNGHGSMLVYSLLHLTGYDLSIDDLKNFRQLHSKTPGHPEYGYTPGVETTTGPLGQGIANAVGMALAEKVLAAQFNRDDHDIVNHFTYAFLGDGCMMEGISHEACSLAGTLGLGKLIAFYDDNGISIDGEVEGWFTDDTVKRFESYGWQVIPRVNGHDPEEIKQAIETARADTDQPTLICCKTIIGYGSPNKEGKEESHGAALGADEVALTRERLGWSHPAFEIPADIKSQWDAKAEGARNEAAWDEKFAAYKAAYPEQAEEFVRRMNGELPGNFDEIADQFIADVNSKADKIASRKASQNAIEALAPKLPELFGGSADLAASNLTLWSGAQGVSAADASGNYCFYGVREFGMTAIMNGISLHGGLKPYGATFFIFMEYARNAVRMSALMKQPLIHVYTHDSIGLGEDGPTHQPVEQLAAMRATPNLNTWRPADAVESAVAWVEAIKSTETPNAMVFSRQGLPHMERTEQQLADIRKGGYVLKASATPDAIIIATGSEVSLAMDAAAQLETEGKAVQVVSMPCPDVFEQQADTYKAQVLPAGIKRFAIEAGSKDFWYKYVGLDGAVIGMDSFGESAPAGELFKHFGITVEALVDLIKSKA